MSLYRRSAGQRIFTVKLTSLVNWITTEEGLTLTAWNGRRIGQCAWRPHNVALVVDAVAALARSSFDSRRRPAYQAGDALAEMDLRFEGCRSAMGADNINNND